MSSNGVIIPSATFLALATIILGTRLIVRFKTQKRGIEDVLVVLAWLFAATEAVIIWVTVNVNYDELNDDQVVPWQKIWFANIFIHNTTLMFSKLSLFSQYLKLFTEGKTRKASYCGIAFVCANAILQLFMTLFSCTPIAAIWDENLLPVAHCLPFGTLWYPNAIGNIVASIAVFIVPIPKIITLPFTRRMRISLIMIFAVGAFDIVLSILRIYSVYVSVLVGLQPSGTWASLESTVAIICASAGALRQFVADTIPEFFLSLRDRLSSGDSKHGNIPIIKHESTVVLPEGYRRPDKSESKWEA